MARHATIIGQCLDLWGEPWDIREARPAPGFDVLIGWPEGQRGKGHGGPRAIPTQQLADYMAAHCRRGCMDQMARALPIGRSTITRLRRLLGLNQHHWWHEREHDLATMTGTEFASKHGVSEAAACLARQRYLGISRQRPDGWWREPEARDLILGWRHTADIADRLGVSVGAVRRLRWMLNQQGDADA